MPQTNRHWLPDRRHYRRNPWNWRFISYNQVKQSSSHPETFGHGEIEGVAASESANNGACGATMIPMLTLGVPGDGATAILMGAFMIHGMIPGPTLFEEQGNILYAIMLGLIVVNVFMYILGSGFTRFYAPVFPTRFWRLLY